MTCIYEEAFSTKSNQMNQDSSGDAKSATNGQRLDKENR